MPPSPKLALFAQFAAVAKSLAHPSRLELLEQLAQGERSVEILAQRTGLSVANTSQHLQQMRRSGMVVARRDGKFVFYALADDAVLDLVSAGTLMLEHLSPSDYQVVRTALGHGSGFDSPGFRRTHDVSPLAGAAFDRLLARRGITIDALLDRPDVHPDVFQIAEGLLDWDERLVRWRALHLKMVERVIGGHVIGTQGTPVEVLGRRVEVRVFPDLWDARNRLTHARGG